MKQRMVYLDHAATTPVRREALKQMRPFFDQHFANPASLYREGVLAKKTLDGARARIAGIIGAQPDTIVFTDGGSESNNLAIFGVAEANRERGRQIISSNLEHSTVMEPLSQLARQGWGVNMAPSDKSGLIDTDKIMNLITPETVLVSIMYANNEIGAKGPIAEIGRRILKYRQEHSTALPYFHTDACRAAGYLELDVEKLHVDLMSLNSGKIYGPKGAGMLYSRRGVKINARQFGGGQEGGLRAGTENVAGIVGFAAALELAQEEKTKESARLRKLTNYFWKKIQKNFSNAKLNGPELGESRLPNNLNITFPGLDGEQMVLYLDAEGVMCSTASACDALSDEPSHVLCALQIPSSDVRSTLRFSLGRSTTKADIDYTIGALHKAAGLIRLH